MPKYTLHYFDLYGRAEPVRMLFALAGVEYADQRFSFEEWPKLKPNFAGENDIDRAIVDSIADYHYEYLEKVMPFYGVACKYWEGNQIVALRQQIESLPKMKEYLAQRPDCTQ